MIQIHRWPILTYVLHQFGHREHHESTQTHHDHHRVFEHVHNVKAFTFLNMASGQYGSIWLAAAAGLKRLRTKKYSAGALALRTKGYATSYPVVVQSLPKDEYAPFTLSSPTSTRSFEWNLERVLMPLSIIAKYTLPLGIYNLRIVSPKNSLL